MKRTLILAVAGLAVIAAGGCKSAGQTGPRTVKPALARDIQTVVAETQDVQIGIGQLADGTSTDINGLAQAAQTAHDDLTNLKDQIALDSPSNNAGADLFNAVDELKNSMGALVAYTGNPNPATLASLTTQYKTAVADWDSAVAVIYQGTVSAPPSSLAG